MSLDTKVYLGLETGGAGELLKTAVPADYGGFENPTSGEAGNFAEGGDITQDGTYKIHTFTTTNDGVDVFSVTQEITGAEVLIVGAGGGGSNGGGGAGEVIHLTGVTIPVDDYTMLVGKGGLGKYIMTAGWNGEDGGDTVAFDGDALEETADGGGGGGKFEEDGNAGGCGGGGAGDTANPPGTTSGGASTSDDNATDHGKAGRGNGGYINVYAPAGGGGGAVGLGGYPTGVQNGGDGGIGYLDDISGESLRYANGGGGGVYGYGYGGSATDGGGDGKSRGGGNGEDASFFGCGGGGAGWYANGGDGFDGVIIIRYQDVEEADFRGWTETHTTGHIFVESSDLSDSTDGTIACKLVGADFLTSETETCVANEDRWFGFTIWSKGDGTEGVKYLIKDETGAATIISGETSSIATWKRTFLKFQTPTDCVSISVKLSTDSTTGVLIDDVSLYDFGPVVFTLNEDVLQDPKPQWGYGFNSNEPDDVVAGTGMATFTLENSSGKYSPEHASALSSFEEGMQVKIQIETDEWADSDPLSNGSMEANSTGRTSGYNCFRKITIDHTKVEADHTNMPFPIQGTYSEIADTDNGGWVENVDASGTISGADDVPADLVFSMKPDGSDPLSHEIELYDKTTGQITAWVKIPTMDADTDQDIYMCFGNEEVTTSQEDIGNVWTNYDAVYHCAEASGDLLDSTGNGKTLADNGNPVYRQAGHTGYAVTLDGDDYFYNADVISFDGQSDWEVMQVLKSTASGTAQYTLTTGTHDGMYIQLQSADDKPRLKIDDTVDDELAYGTTDVIDGSYHTLHAAVDDSANDLLMYVDGIKEGDGTNGAVNALEDTVYLGARDSGTGGLIGDMSEARFYEGYHGEDYIKTEHNTLQSGFYSIGSAVELDDIESWTETYQVEVEDTEVNGGSYSALITNGRDFYSTLVQDVFVEPDLSYKLSLYAKGDFRFKVEPLEYDSTTQTYLVGTDLISDQTGNNADWAVELSDAFTPECAKIRVTLSADGYTDTCYYDDVQVLNQETNYTRTKFYGFIESIEPASGKFQYPTTRVTCRDWMGYCNQQEAGLHAMETNKEADQGINTLLGDFEDQPQADIFDVGTQTFDYIFLRMWSRSSMARALWQLVWNENGRLFTKGNGTLVFDNADARDSKTSDFTIDGTMSKFAIDYNTRNRYNSMNLTFRVKELSDTDVVFSAGDGIAIPANSTVIIRCDYKDPVTGKKLWCSSVTEPTAGNGNLAFSGTNCTVDDFTVYSDCAIMTITNAGAAETMTTCDIDADDAIRERSEIGIEDTDVDSIARIGIKRWKSVLDLVDDIPTIKTRVEDLLSEWASSHISEATIRICANQNWALARSLVEAEPNDMFTVKETATGVDKNCYINYIGYEQDSTMLWVIIRADIIEV